MSSQSDARNYCSVSSFFKFKTRIRVLISRSIPGHSRGGDNDTAEVLCSALSVPLPVLCAAEERGSEKFYFRYYCKIKRGWSEQPTEPTEPTEPTDSAADAVEGSGERNESEKNVLS